MQVAACPSSAPEAAKAQARNPGSGLAYFGRDAGSHLAAHGASEKGGFKGFAIRTKRLPHERFCVPSWSVQALKLELAPAQIDLLMSFMDLLQKWNKVYNLTSVRDPQEMLTHHLLDSLAAVPALLRHVSRLPVEEGKRLPLLDVGSGGGLPGVVFAICCPQIDVNCVDTVGKKAAFIQQVAASCACPICAAFMTGWKTSRPGIRSSAAAPLHPWWTSPPGRARRWPMTASGLP
jgi:hypothetical protein